MNIWLYIAILWIISAGIMFTTWTPEIGLVYIAICILCICIGIARNYSKQPNEQSRADDRDADTTRAKTKRNRKSYVVITLAIAIPIIITIVVVGHVYTQASKFDDFLIQMTDVRKNVLMLYASQPDFSGLTPELAVKAGLDSTNVYGEPIKVSVTPFDSSSFTISTGVPVSACRRILADPAYPELAERLRINGLSPDEICQSLNTIELLVNCP